MENLKNGAGSTKAFYLFVSLANKLYLARRDPSGPMGALMPPIVNDASAVTTDLYLKLANFKEFECLLPIIDLRIRKDSVLVSDAMHLHDWIKGPSVIALAASMKNE